MIEEMQIVRVQIIGHPRLDFRLRQSCSYRLGSYTKSIERGFNEVRFKGSGGLDGETAVYCVTLDTGEKITINADNPLLVVTEIPKQQKI